MQSSPSERKEPCTPVKNTRRRRPNRPRSNKRKNTAAAKKPRKKKAAYVGKDARKILSAESADALLALIDAKALSPTSSRWTIEVQPVLNLLVLVIRSFDEVIVRTMKLNLHPQWEPSINNFVQAYENFSEPYIKLFPRSRNDDLMTPKIAYIKFEVVRWIKKFKRSLLFVSEQAFEGVHYLFLAKEKLYSVPKTGEELIAGERRYTSDPSFLFKRKGALAKQANVATKKRSKANQNASSKAASSCRTADRSTRAKKSDKINQPKPNSSSNMRARELLRKAVAAFNADNVLACGDGCYERMKEIVDYLESGKDSRNAPWKFDSSEQKSKTQIYADEIWQP